MATVSSKYFTKNGSSDVPNCQVNPGDRVNVAAVVTFSSVEVGKQYKAELKIRLPIGSDFSFYTGYRTVGLWETFLSPDFTNPIPAGSYQVLWIVVYDINGNQVGAG